MRFATLILLLGVSSAWGQVPETVSPQQPPAVPAQPSPQPASITIPAGTKISATLVSPITVKARRGDAVRAVTAFPVTVGTQTVIPVGAYLAGVVTKVSRRGPTVQMRFTQIVYPSGYTLSIRGEERYPEAQVNIPVAAAPPSAAAPSDVAANDLFGAQQTTSPPPLSPPQNHIARDFGIAVAVSAGTLVAVLLWHHYRGNGETVLFDAGWQFEVVLQEPASVDAATIAGTVAAPAAQ